MKNKETLLYIYILGICNRENYIRGVVPFRINKEEIFYGPCKKLMRGEIKSLWEERKNEKSKMPKIYLMGINPTTNSKKPQDNMSLKPRKILFAGEVLEIFTFKEAWDHYDQIISTSLNEDYKQKVKKMRTGIESEKGTFESPLHLEPYLNDNGILTGYKHRTNMHKRENKQ